MALAACDDDLGQCVGWWRGPAAQAVVLVIAGHAAASSSAAVQARSWPAAIFLAFSAALASASRALASAFSRFRASASACFSAFARGFGGSGLGFGLCLSRLGRRLRFGFGSLACPRNGPVEDTDII